MATTEERQKKCEDLIDERLKRRLSQFLPDFNDLAVCTAILEEDDADMLEQLNEENKEDEEALEEAIKDAAREAFQNKIHEKHYGIGREVKITHTIVLSGGGPSDEFEIDFDEDGDVTGGRYRYKDWFDGAVRELSTEQAQELVDNIGLYEEGAPRR